MWMCNLQIAQTTPQSLIKAVLQVPNMHTVTALACSPDAAQLLVATIMGALDLYRLACSSQLYRQRYLLQYSLDGSAVVQDKQTGAPAEHELLLRSSDMQYNVAQPVPEH